jgi:hypothetical protein
MPYARKTGEKLASVSRFAPSRIFKKLFGSNLERSPQQAPPLSPETAQALNRDKIVHGHSFVERNEQGEWVRVDPLSIRPERRMHRRISDWSDKMHDDRRIT